MSNYVNTNIQSVFAQRSISQNTFALQKNIERLSTGLRINRAADDAAGLAISEKLNSQIRGFDKAQQNIGDAVSMVQTAEGALSVVQDNLQRIRELVVQATNGTNGLNEQNAIQREINGLVTAIEDVGDGTKFNGIALLDGSANTVTFQTGADNGQTTQVNFDEMIIDIDATTANSMGASAIALSALKITNNDSSAVGGEAAAGVGNTAKTTTPLTHLDTMITNVSRMRSVLGATQNSLLSKVDYLSVAKENAMASKARITDADIAAESSGFVKNQILQQSAAAMLAQANQSPQIALNLLP
jgi:flagellin